MKIAVFTLATPNLKYAEISNENTRKYCEKHGYDFILKTDLLCDKAVCHWSKVLWLEKILTETDYDFVFQKDADSLFVNFDIPLERYTDASMTISQQGMADRVNTGHIMIQNTPENIKLLHDWHTSPDGLLAESPYDQRVFNRLLRSGRIKGLKILPSPILNAFYFTRSSKRGELHNTICDDTLIVHWFDPVRTPGWLRYFDELKDGYKKPYEYKDVYGEIYDKGRLPNYGKSNHGKKAYGLIGSHVKSVIDFGCGDNRFLERLRKRKLRCVGVDVANPNANMIADITRFLPITSGSFDLATCFDLLEHLTEEDVHKALKEIFRVAPEAIFTISSNPSVFKAADGRPLHLTVKPISWWIEVIRRNMPSPNEIIYTSAGIYKCFRAGKRPHKGKSRQDRIEEKKRKDWI